MANKRITQLPSSSLNPSLSGVAPLVISGTTFQVPLSTLRQTLVDSGSHTFSGSQTILGNLNVSGSLTAQQYIVSSSVINVTNYNVSGSTIFGNTLDDTHKFTGSVDITGSLIINGVPYATSSFDGSIYATTGSNTFTDSQTISGSIFFGDGGSIQSASGSSADGNGFTTMILTPDTSLGSDQYIILDPTAPSHIHIRQGGTIDNSGADLYLGGEKNFVRINDSSPSVRMQIESDAFVTSYSFSSGSGYSTAEWYTVGGNHYVRFNTPTMDVYNAIWAYNSPSIFEANYSGYSEYINFTVDGSSTPGFPAAPSFYVTQAPPSSPTYLDSVYIEIRENRQTYIQANSNDVRIEAADDVRIYSRDTFQLINRSPDEPIELRLDYDDTDKVFYFNSNGSITFPDSTVQNTAFTTSSISGFATTGSNTFTGSQTITGSLVVTQGITGSLQGTSSWSQNAVSSSYPFKVTGSSIISYNTSNVSSSEVLFIGNNSGQNATSADFSNFIGTYAGKQATYAQFSNFIGYNAGQSASNAANSNFIGNSAGQNALYADRSNFIGVNAGEEARNAEYSNFIGSNAGIQATNAPSSNFIGQNAGFNATNANSSNFIGTGAGYNAASASFSILLGYQSGFAETLSQTIKSNNIIIGNNITLEKDRQDSINIGGLIFGTGSYSNIYGNVLSGSANGRIGINQPLPIYSLDVSGSGRFTNGLEITGSLNIGSVNENLTLNIGGGGSTYTFNYNSGSIFYVSASVGTNTYNITNIPTTPQRALTLTFVLEQGSTPYSASSYQFDGGAISVKWADSIIPTGSANKTDVIGLTAFRSGSSWNVLGSLTSFG